VHVADGGDAPVAQPLGGARADAPQPLDRQGPEPSGDVLEWEDDEAVGLVEVGGNLGQELVRCDAD
jgi:hypothetical protein